MEVRFAELIADGDSASSLCWAVPLALATGRSFYQMALKPPMTARKR